MPVFDRRRILLEIVSLIGFSDFINAQSLHLVQGVRHWRHIRGGRGLQLIHEIDNRRQFFDKFCHFRLGELEPGQRGDVLNLVFI